MIFKYMVYIYYLERSSNVIACVKHFKELNNEELYDILRLRCEIFVVEQNCPYQDCDLKDKEAYHLFIKNHHEIIAYLRILNKGASYDEISIGRVVVHKEYRRKGIAQKMIRDAIEFIEEKLGETSVRLSGQLYAERLYESLGFRRVSEVYLEDNIPHVEMLYEKKTSNLGRI